MVSTLKIELDGNLITGRIDGIDNFVVTYKNENEEGNTDSSFSSELTFYDDGYQYINSILINNQFGFSNIINVRIYDDCCSKLVFEGIIRGDSIDWCSDGCYVSANILKDKTKENCIKNTLIYDNHDGFLYRSNPTIRYCVETRPNFFLYILFSLGAQLTVFIGQIFYPIIQLLYWLDLDSWGKFLEDLINEGSFFYIQCGRHHPSPYLRNYIKNACKKCGLTFRSSILNGDNSSNFPWGSIYYNTVLFSAPIKKGRSFDIYTYEVIKQNLPNETVETLMKTYLEPLFNAKYKIVGSELIFERKDYFVGNLSWINFNDLLSNNKIADNKLCWSWIDKERYSYGDFKYGMDAIEYIGNEALERYNDIVEWNPPPINPTQVGSKQVTLEIGAARFREDGLDESIYDDFTDTFSILTGINWNVIPSQYNPFKKYKKVLLMAQDTTQLYKFLIYDQSLGNGDNGGRVRNYYTNAFCGADADAAQDERFNYPFWFMDKNQYGQQMKNNLYTLFHYIDNPRLPSAEQFNFNFTFAFDCDILDTFSFDKTVGGLNLNGAVVTGKINEIVVNFTNRTIKVTGIV